MGKGHIQGDVSFTSRRLYFDGSALANLLAIDMVDDILLASGYDCVTLREIAEEHIAISTSSATSPNSLSGEAFVDIRAVPSLHIHEFAPSGQEESLVAFAILVPDNLARLLTTVIRDGAALGTDDTCVARVMRQQVPDIEILGLPDLLQKWQSARHVSTLDMAAVLEKVELHAQFDLPANHPYANWWRQTLENSRQTDQ